MGWWDGDAKLSADSGIADAIARRKLNALSAKGRISGIPKDPTMRFHYFERGDYWKSVAEASLEEWRENHCPIACREHGGICAERE